MAVLSVATNANLPKAGPTQTQPGVVIVKDAPQGAAVASDAPA